MSSLIERITAQYRDRETFSLDVAEWGEAGKPLTVFYKAPTLATLSKVRRESKDDEIKMMALLVASCALNENGELLFRPMNWLDLFNGADPGVVQRIGTAIMEKVRFDTATIEAAEKN